MIKNIFRKTLVLMLCHALVYAPLLRADQISLPAGDLVAPKITQEQYVDKVAQGANHNITVTVTDDVGVSQVTLYYRSIGTESYKRQNMDNIVNTDDYHVTINADQIKTPGLEYYVQAMDDAGNTLLHGYSFSPLSVKTVTDDTAIASSNSSTAVFEAAESSSIWSNKWLWIGLGVVAVGLAASGGGGGSDPAPPPTATLTVNANNP
jgi:hypothetical protein